MIIQRTRKKGQQEEALRTTVVNDSVAPYIAKNIQTKHFSIIEPQKLTINESAVHKIFRPKGSMSVTEGNGTLFFGHETSRVLLI